MVRKYSELDGQCPLTLGARAAYDHAQLAAAALKYNIEELRANGLTEKLVADINRAIDLELDWGAISCAYEALVDKLMQEPAFQQASEIAASKHGAELLRRSLEAQAKAEAARGGEWQQETL